MKKYLCELTFESLILIAILKSHSIDTMSPITSIITRIILTLIVIYTLQRVFKETFNIRIFYINLILNLIILIIYNDAKIFPTDIFIRSVWRGYMSAKWGMIILIVIFKQMSSQNNKESLEQLLLKSTKYPRIRM